MAEIRIINHSRGEARWPTWFVAIVARWIALRAGINWQYTITVENARTRRRGKGVAVRDRCWVSYHRRGETAPTRDKEVDEP